MNGAHDLGGMHGFGPVLLEPDEPARPPVIPQRGTVERLHQPPTSFATLRSASIVVLQLIRTGSR